VIDFKGESVIGLEENPHSLSVRLEFAIQENGTMADSAVSALAAGAPRR
jgi:hypothetical protein